jgi:cbb3-type cytochrome oxidase subunit 3
MEITKLISVLGIAIYLSACAPGNREGRNESVMADSTSNAFISSSAAVENNKDTTHRFIRTADLKFKVKSVIKATYAIEDLTNRLGGFVTYTNLSSTIDNVSTTAISADSSLESTHYTVSNSITIRIPNTKLDTTLKEISKNIDYLDYRVIKADDVALQILSNNLTQKRSARNEQRLTNAIDNRGKKLYETANAEEVLLRKQQQADEAKIANLALTDQINFSTINLNIYQRQTTKRELISNDKNIDAYEPGFGSKLLEALKFGWDILEALLVFLTQLWGLFLLGIIAWILYWKFGRNQKSK